MYDVAQIHYNYTIPHFILPLVIPDHIPNMYIFTIEIIRGGIPDESLVKSRMEYASCLLIFTHKYYITLVHMYMYVYTLYTGKYMYLYLLSMYAMYIQTSFISHA